MRKIIFVFFVLLQSVYPVMSQINKIFYNVCENQIPKYVDFHQDEIAVKTFTDDSLIFEVLTGWGLTRYSGKKVPDFNFLEGGEAGRLTHFYVYKVDDNSFFIATPDLGFTYYHTNKNKKYETDNTKRCALDHLEQFRSLFKPFKEKESDIEKQKQKLFDSQTKGVITEFIKNYKSLKNDPALEKGIFQWWQNSEVPLLRIYFMQPGYEFTRNEYGVVLRKTIDTILLLKNKKEGRCYIQWRSLGYESLGGNGFDTEVGAWIKQEQIGFGYSRVSLNFPGNRKIIAGYDYEVDCAPFQ